ncbi:hypothetical protein F2Q69_00054686 [Brassica cretica]|uniref:No apical meristem-associated C-terminal domain-containing protein n=1 Tax=Brassica cretica TaxID=69181 RepID=A0A8S9N2M5_BRACR|nr:hypothetical protein F2Q69_00054686 [Brassica cretica]
MAISLLHGVSPQRNGVSLSGSCRRKKTAFLYRFLSSTKENGEISLVVALGEEAKCQQDIAFGSYEDSVELSSSQVPFLPTQAYEAATRERSSGQNENDVVKRAHEIFYNNHKKRFLLEHAWNELRNDQKWCELSSSKNAESSKKRKGDEDGADCSSSQPTETMRLEGVKAAKAHGKKTVVEENAEGECGQGVSVYGVERVHGSGAVVNDWSREWSCFLSCSCHVVVMCEMLLLGSCCGHVSCNVVVMLLYQVHVVVMFHVRSRE